MALTPSTSFTQNTAEVNAGVVADTTSNYGTGGNPARGDAANYLLWAKLDEDGARTFSNPSFGDVLSVMSWAVVSLISGWYQRILQRIQPYVNITTYVIEQSSGATITQYASIVYYAPTNKVYKRINTAGSGSIPTDPAFWEEVTDHSTLIANTNVTNTITDTYIRSHADDCVKEKFKDLPTCGCDDRNNKTAYYLYGLLLSADASVQSGNYDEMEKTIRQLQSKCSTC